MECQACHVLKFSSLANGHPPFSDYPWKRRTRIAFDHSSHIDDHFKKEEYKEHAPQKPCGTCHKPDQAGQFMLLRKNFEKTCGAGCHAEQIAGKGLTGAKGIPFLRLPGLDIETLEEYEISVGEWPADYNIEEGLTPFMELLLYGEPAFADDLAVVSDFDDFTDLSDSSEEEIVAVGRIIWAIKGLFFDIISHGQESLISRLQKPLKSHLKSHELTALTGQLPIEVVRAAQQKWLPHLMTEVPRYRAGETVTSSTVQSVEEQDSEREKWVKAGGWYRQDLDFTVLYRPTEHADGFMRAWLDLSSRLQKKTDLGSAAMIFAELSNPKGPGLCMKCHSVDSIADPPAFQVNWFKPPPSPEWHTITRFVHTPHFSLLEDDGCLTCHQLDPDPEGKGKVMKAFWDKDGLKFAPLTFTSSFKLVMKATCSSCHTSELAGDTCLICHNYHVGKIAPALLEVPIAGSTPLLQLHEH